jgi:hypothetical protein
MGESTTFHRVLRRKKLVKLKSQLKFINNSKSLELLIFHGEIKNMPIRLTRHKGNKMELLIIGILIAAGILAAKDGALVPKPVPVKKKK